MLNAANNSLYWAARCGGCEIAVLDINEKILSVVKAVNKDIEAIPDNNIDIPCFNRSIRRSEQEQTAKLLRRKSKIIAAFGLYVHKNSIPGLTNVYNREQILTAACVGCKPNDNPIDCPKTSKNPKKTRKELFFSARFRQKHKKI
ncbi:MAG: hypothetical protein LBQ98_08280 [Nitrososphaerota archaeon]|jgi:F420-non-reducing hydrogenase small subunit|nr:hypothetical protein [Nitrososphaerota archaeon]